MAAERPCMNIGPDCLRFEIWNEFVTFHNKMVICSCKGATVVGGGGGWRGMQEVRLQVATIGSQFEQRNNFKYGQANVVDTEQWMYRSKYCRLILKRLSQPHQTVSGGLWEYISIVRHYTVKSNTQTSHWLEKTLQHIYALYCTGNG